ncbi:piggyBac transposable element-derived protein 4 [Trichonephila clavipes]|nr:piggyBac transposable element-derived protein 4 [Trichonephila clavipes]
MIRKYPFIRQSEDTGKKISKKIFLHSIDKVLSNSFLRYKKAVKKSVTYLEFRIQIVEELLHKYEDTAFGQMSPGRPPTVDNPACLTERHFMSDISPTPAKRRHTKQCNVCCSKKGCKKKKRKETRFWCNDFGVALCLEKCF